MLAPAVMISACGLLLLGINNKYSIIVNRIRLLNDERRRCTLKLRDGKELDYLESVRLESIIRQLAQLKERLQLVRNCVMSYSTAIFLFILTSLLIGIDVLFDYKMTMFFMVATFILGMLAVGIGSLFAMRETIRGYKIVEFEIKAEE
ncbi:MAG: DUF2721 domain-containing protein [Ignavibacteria bacterium]|nr:DUF2721 domain-containing protein [Ignavibacteria bacterium]